MVFHQCFHFFFAQSPGSSYPFYLHIGTGRCDVRIQSGGTGRYHFCRHLRTFQVRMVQQKGVYPGLDFFQVAFIGYPFVAAGRAGAVVTVTCTGRSSPKINILGKPLSDVGYPHYFSVQANGFDIATLTRRGELGIRPQDQHITYGQKHTKNKSEFY